MIAASGRGVEGLRGADTQIGNTFCHWPTNKVFELEQHNFWFGTSVRLWRQSYVYAPAHMKLLILLSFNELIRKMRCKMDVKIKINKIKTKLLKILNTLKNINNQKIY